MKRIPGGMKTGLAIGLVAGGVLALENRLWAERLRRTHRILIDLLLNTLTADDPVTARHSRRVADLTNALAEMSGLSRNARATLRVAALLHDLGKIDDRFWEIVHSREPMSAEQRAQMEQHPDESARILEPLEALHPGISAIVSSHHESWDGKGYPEGLRGDAIPLEARLIAVADSFDAMTQPRKYKDPIRPEEAIAKIRAGSGRQFDPAVVELLGTPHVMEEWMRIARDGLSDEQTGRNRKEMVAVSSER